LPHPRFWQHKPSRQEYQHPHQTWRRSR
jgi:hypothetical protein